VIIEEQKIVLIEFINQQGLKLPKNLKQKLAQSDNNPLPTTATGKLKQQQQLQQQKVNLLMKQSTKISGNKGYAEEVDVEEILLPKNYQYNIYGDSSASALQKNTSNNNSSKPRSSVQSSYNQDTDDQEQEEEEEDHHDEDSNYRHYEEEEVYDQVNHKSSTAANQRSLLPPGEIFNRLSDNLKSGFPSSSGGTTSRKNNQLANSWNNLRSSKSSARYSSTSMEDDEPAADDDDHDNMYDKNRNNNGTSSSRPGTATTSSVAALPQPPRYEELMNNANKKFSVTDTNTGSNRGITEEIDYEKLQEMQAIRRESPRNTNSQVASSSGGKPGNNGYLSFGQMKSFSPNSSGNQGANNTQGNPYLASASADQRAVGASQQQQQQQQQPQNQPESGNGANRSEEVRPDGTRVIRYRNGTSKELHPNGKALVKFTNGDTKLTESSSGKVIYFYSQANTTHTTYPDGLELFQFPNGQVIH
jgi:hypothetical protein